MGPCRIRAADRRGFAETARAPGRSAGQCAAEQQVLDLLLHHQASSTPRSSQCPASWRAESEHQERRQQPPPWSVQSRPGAGHQGTFPPARRRPGPGPCDVGGWCLWNVDVVYWLLLCGGGHVVGVWGLWVCGGVVYGNGFMGVFGCEEWAGCLVEMCGWGGRINLRDGFLFAGLLVGDGGGAALVLWGYFLGMGV